MLIKTLTAEIVNILTAYDSLNLEPKGTRENLRQTIANAYT